MGKELIKLALADDVMPKECLALLCSNSTTDGKEILPSRRKRLRAFRLVPDALLSVVVLGQDPYPQPGKATGLAFEVAKKFTIKPKAKQTQEQLLKDTLGSLYYMNPKMGRERDARQLKQLAQRGVLWMNAALTVPEGRKLGHVKEWENWSRNFLGQLKKKNLEYLILGSEAEDILWKAWGCWPGKLSGKERIAYRNEVRKRPGMTYVFRIHPSPLNERRPEFLECWGDVPTEDRDPFLEIDGRLHACGRPPVFRLPLP